MASSKGLTRLSNRCWGEWWPKMGATGTLWSRTCSLESARYHKPPQGSHPFNCFLEGNLKAFWMSPGKLGRFNQPHIAASSSIYGDEITNWQSHAPHQRSPRYSPACPTVSLWLACPNPGDPAARSERRFQLPHFGAMPKRSVEIFVLCFSKTDVSSIIKYIYREWNV